MAVKRFSYANTGQVRAEARHVRSSARKVRLVLEDIRGRSVVDARARLLFSPRAVARDVELVLRSAVTNAEVNHGLSPDDLVIAEAYANEGMTIKRFRPRARGRASRINKRTSHIVIVLRSVEGEEVIASGEATEATDSSARERRVAASRKETDSAVEAEVETTAAETAEETVTADATGEAEAKPKPRTRKKAEPAEGEAEAKPKPKPRRKAAAAEGEAAEKPAPRKRAPKKTETDDGEQG